MRKLKHISSFGEGEYYRLDGDNSDVNYFVASHPKTRGILTDANVYGGEFITGLREATKYVLGHFPNYEEFKTFNNSIAVHITLRGGMNWDVAAALHEVFGINATRSMSSCQREQLDTGKYKATKTSYDRTNIPDQAFLIFLDIIATTTTSRKILGRVIDNTRKDGGSINRLLILTVGADRTEEMAEDMHKRMVKVFPGYRGTDLVYHEGIFTLADEQTPIRVKKEGTDFLKTGALLTPEYEAELYGADSFEFARNVLSPCAIGDGFSRGYGLEEYFQEQLEFWEKEMALADQGVTLIGEMKARWPEEGYGDMDILREAKSKEWRGVDEEKLRRIYDLHTERWSEGFMDFARSPNALRQICGNQVSDIERRMK